MQLSRKFSFAIECWFLKVVLVYLWLKRMTLNIQLGFFCYMSSFSTVLSIIWKLEFVQKLLDEVVWLINNCTGLMWGSVSLVQYAVQRIKVHFSWVQYFALPVQYSAVAGLFSLGNSCWQKVDWMINTLWWFDTGICEVSTECAVCSAALGLG